ncbi:RNA polymerase [Oenococcus sicerae]|uniref:RNA polymerase n=1 Tax=Oenococcus sicerae TaxID=2203724 RepID=UPI0010B1B2A9|nr:hypothetical protein OAL24_00388 [Oenococcus sicerae]
MKVGLRTKIIASVIVLFFVVGLSVFAARALSGSSGSKKESSVKKTVTSKRVSTKSTPASSSESSTSSSLSASVNSTSSSSSLTSWNSIDLNNQIAILIQAAFPNNNAVPSDQFTFSQNYWDMTGSISNGEINRYVPNADSFAGISDILSAKITISNGQITVTRPITAAFTLSLDQAISNYYSQSSSINNTHQLAARVVSPAKLAELQKNH